MKKIVCCLLAATLLFCTTACTGNEKVITCDQVISAYEEAGYGVLHQTDPEYIFEEDCVCYVRAEHPDVEEYIYFYFFADHESAQAYAKEHDNYWAASLFSFFLWDPTWIRMDIHDNIVIEYTKYELYKPYRELL